ncbi:MAG: purine-nucleoside phosphorylase [Oscillospiraceae bacterium]|nr:purine-nucleoside phosphorylase [Oscillospiraceae bacterium]
MSMSLEARAGDIAPAVILTQDPLDAKYIAETRLENPVCHNKVRNMLGYTGLYRGKRVSVQGVGIGPVSAGIYTQELGEDYAPERFIKIEMAQSLRPEVRPGDIVLALSAHTTSRMNRLRFGGRVFPAAADYGLLDSAYELCKKQGWPVQAGPVVSAESRFDLETAKKLGHRGALALDMETSVVYTSAARFGVKALSALGIVSGAENENGLDEEGRKALYERLIDLALALL